MSLKIRLSRAGAKKRPYYRIVIADSKSPRDGRYIEKVGTYDPLRAAKAPPSASSWSRSGSSIGCRRAPSRPIACSASSIRPAWQKRDARIEPEQGPARQEALEREEAKKTAAEEKVKAAAEAKEAAAKAAAEAAAAPPPPVEEPVAEDQAAEPVPRLRPRPSSPPAE